jgi:monoamine oxidase
MSLHSPPTTVDVAVVGAGVSGLFTAHRLVAAGHTCAVFESRSHVGGRLRTHDGPGGLHDLGATWFWPGEQRVAALVAELGVATHSQHCDGDAMFQGGPQVQRIQGNPIDVPSYRFTHGAASLTDALAARLAGVVWRSTPVEVIEHDSLGLRVHHPSGTAVAQHVVLALPPSLALHRITFRPELPHDVAELARRTPVWMGNMAKVVVTYPQPFWRRHGLAGAAFSHVGPLREVHDMSGPEGRDAALFGFAPVTHRGAPAAAEVIAQLVELFGPEAASPTEVVIADWSSEPDTVPQAVSDAGPTGTPEQTYGHPWFAQPLAEGRLHWAGTETSPHAAGHIEGALAAAERAVAAIDQNSQLTKSGAF